MENGNQNKVEFGFGQRIVELGYLAQQMKSYPNCSTPMYRLYGLGSILYIECQSCKTEPKIYTGKQHRSQNTVKGRQYGMSTRSVLFVGMINKLIFGLFLHITQQMLSVFWGNIDYINHLGTNILPSASRREIFRPSGDNMRSSLVR